MLDIIAGCETFAGLISEDESDFNCGFVIKWSRSPTFALLWNSAGYELYCYTFSDDFIPAPGAGPLLASKFLIYDGCFLCLDVDNT